MMRMLIEPTGEWSAAYQLSDCWLYDYEVVSEPGAPFIKDLWQHLCETYTAQHPRNGTISWPARGVFMPSGFAATGKLPQPRKTYDPRRYAASIFLDLQRMSPTDSTSLLKFVNTWGLLCLKNPLAQWAGPLFDYDGLDVMARWIEARQRWLRVWDRLKEGQPPPLADTGWLIDDDPDKIRMIYERNKWPTKTTWDHLAIGLNRLVGSIHLGTASADGRLRPIYRLATLADLLNVELWHWVTADGAPLHRCPQCDTFFIRSRPNQDFCTRAHAVKAAVARWKKKTKTAKKRIGDKHGTKKRKRSRTL